MRPLILQSNDDGFDAEGLRLLRASMLSFADVIVCAPLSNQSASSHALTLNDMLRLKQHDDTVFSVSGTPADCVYVALHSEQRVLPRVPDMVVSGMNHGPNLGVDVVYSGTVAAAREGAQRNIPSIAVSASNRADRRAAAQLAGRVIERLWRRLSQERPASTPLISMNIPPGKQWKVVATRSGVRSYDDEVVYRDDPRGKPYLWIGGANVEHEQDIGTDTGAWDAGHASVTPLSLKLNEDALTPLVTSLAERHPD